MTELKAPHIDFDLQFSFARKDNATEHNVIRVLKKLAQDVADEEIDRVGAIIVLGSFERQGNIVHDIVQMKPKSNPIASYVTVTDTSAPEIFREFSSNPYDGAIIVERTGQILGAGVYLNIEHPTLEIPDGCGTRHKAAASFSMREDVIAVFTLSEENNTVRVWKDGKPTVELF